MITKFKSSVVLGLSTVMLGTSLALPIPTVEGATLAKGFQAYPMPDFFGQFHHSAPKVSITHNPSSPKKALANKAPSSKKLSAPSQPVASVKAIPDAVMVCKMVPHTVAVTPSAPAPIASKPATSPRKPSQYGRLAQTGAKRFIARRLHSRSVLYKKLAEKPHAILSPQAMANTASPEANQTLNLMAQVIPGLTQSHSTEVTPSVIKDEKHQAVMMLASGLEGLQAPDTASTSPAAPASQPTPKAKPAPKRSRNTRKQNPIVKMPMAFPFANANEANQDVILKSGITTSINEVDLTIGKAKVLNLSSPAARISISNPEVASAVVLSPTQIQLVGKQVGVANLLVWGDSNSSRYTTIDISIHRDVSVLTKQLQYLDPGINVIPLAADDSIILTGETDSPETAQLAVEIAKRYFSKSGGTTAAAPAAAPATGSAVSSLAPGSASPLPDSKVLNLIKVKGEPSTKLELARQKLKNLDPNIHLDILPGPGGIEKAVLTGRVASSAIISRAINTTSIFYGQPGLQVITGPGGNGIRNTGSGNFQGSTAFTDNVDINILQGSIITDTSGNVVSMMEVAQKPQIRCSVKFLDVSRTVFRQLGSTLTGSRRGLAFANVSGAKSSLAGRAISAISGNSSISTTASAANGGVIIPGSKLVTETTSLTNTLGGGITQVFTINQHFQAALSALEEENKVRSLAEPTLTMMSGEKGSFLAGGELPIPTAGQNGQITITYHEFGIRLNLIATLTEDNKIHMQIAPEISSVDPTVAVTTPTVSVPGFKTRRMQTTFEMNQGESFMLAGLFNQEDSDIFSHFPGIGNLPIIGSFFSAKNSNRRNTEMVVIIQPEVVYSPPSPTPLTVLPEGNVQQVAKGGQEN